MSVVLKYVLSCVIIHLATGEGTTKYPGGCIYVGKQADASLRYLTGLGRNLRLVNCSNLSRSSFNYTQFNDSITSLLLSRNALTTFDTSAVLRFSKLTTIDLGKNRISSISGVNSSSSRVTNIYLGFNDLERIPTVLFNVFKSLTTLNLFRNKITAIKEGDFDGADALSFLTVAGNPIEQPADSAFSTIRHQLMSLDLAHCGLTFVPKFVSDMPALYTVNLGHNNISELPEHAFVNNTHLQLIALNANKINTIHANAFEGANDLIFLELSNNNISTLPENVFRQMGDKNSGMYVNLYENPVRCDCKLLWLKTWLADVGIRDELEFTCAQPARNRGKMFHDISAHDITCLPNDKDWTGGQTDCDTGNATGVPSKKDADKITICPVKCDCYHLNGSQYHFGLNSSSIARGRKRWWLGRSFPVVDCSKAGLSAFPEDIRQDVKHLRMYKNNIRSLSISSLAKYQSLEILNLEGCGLKTILPDSDISFPNMKMLWIENNDLEVLNKEHLESFPNLKTLKISHNKLRTIPKDLFVNNRQLQVLIIGPNPVTGFDPRCLAGLDPYVVSLRNLSLYSVPLINSEKLGLLELSDNFIASIPNHTFGGVPDLSRLMMGHNKIVEIEADAFKGAIKLVNLDLTQNLITELPNGVFNDLPREKLVIELWRNRLYCDCNLRWFKEWIEELEDEDPTNEIRFTCMKPWHIHARTSDDLRPEDLVCQSDDDALPKPDEDIDEIDEEYYNYLHGKYYNGGQMALAICLTILFTVLLAIAIRLICRLRDRRARYHRHSEETARMTFDM